MLSWLTYPGFCLAMAIGMYSFVFACLTHDYKHTDGHLWNEDSWHHPRATALLYDISLQHLMNLLNFLFVMTRNCAWWHINWIACTWLEYDDKLMWSDLVFTQTNVDVS